MSEEKWFGEQCSKKLRPEVKTFTQAMEIVLKENDYKGGWKNCTLEYLINKLDEEVKELKEALTIRQKYIELNRGSRSVEDCWYDLSCKSSEENILWEASDVANIAMMLADVCESLKPEILSHIQESKPQVITRRG